MGSNKFLIERPCPNFQFQLLACEIFESIFNAKFTCSELEEEQQSSSKVSPGTPSLDGDWNGAS
jgi:hypothetical protein